MTADDIFGTAGAASLPASTMLSVPAAAMSQTTVKPTAEKGVFDDLDDDFEGLEDAKEGSADDDFANISRDDFNPVFDHSPPASQAKSESTAFGNESTFDFVSHSSAAGSTVQHQPQPQPQPQQQQQKTADTHDWDALFAGLDEAAPATSSPGESGPRKGDLRPPPPGRALTEQGEHDDPILKSLTSMGYSRSDAVASLEKYDYNLEKVRILSPSCASPHVAQPSVLTRCLPGCQLSRKQVIGSKDDGGRTPRWDWSCEPPFSSIRDVASIFPGPTLTLRSFPFFL